MQASVLLEGLNDEQLKAVTHLDGPLLIVAGAGTGKTTVITRRIAYLVEQKLARPEEILALTFTDKAAGEMEARVDQLLPLGNYDLWISTFHSFCERILKQHGLDIGIPNDFKLLDDVGGWVLVNRNLEKFKLDYYRPLGSPNKFIDGLLSHFSKCKDEMVTPEEYVEFAEKQKLGLDNPDALFGDDDQITEIKRIEEVAGAYHVYQKLLLDNEYLDFGDLINYTMELFRRRPNILKRYQQQFKFILVDEFQDTNFAQYQLIKLLTQGNQKAENSKQGTHQNNLVVVGDDDQSIYKFRGASVSNILKLKEDYAGVSEITLTQNYRSTQNILDLAYNFIQQNNPNRLEAKLGIDKRLKANIPGDGVIQVIEGRDLSEELDLVIKKIVELKAQSPDDSWNDFAILVRANSAAEELISRLDSVGITYTFMANRGLYRKRVIADLINYMKLLDNYHESRALYRVLNLPKFSIEPFELSSLTSFAEKKTLSLYEAMQHIRTIAGITESSAKRIEELLSLLRQHAELIKTRTSVEVFIALVDDLGFLAMLEKDTLENAESREYLEQFYKKIEAFEDQNEDKSLRNFIDTLNLEMQAGAEGPIKFDPNLGPESLKVMTVHSAKGLEFKYVFIINMVDQRFPTRQHRDTIELPEGLIKDILPEGDFHLQEERRLFYVALTRAKTNLYISWGRDYGGAKMKKPSVFLVESALVPSENAVQATGKVVFSKKIKTNKQQVYHQLPERFSFTDIGVFENCPMEYKFRLYLRLPLPGTPHISFGQTIHKSLEKFGLEYKAATDSAQLLLFGSGPAGAKLPDFKRLEELYEQCWIDEWYHTKKEKEEYRMLGKVMLKSVYEDFVARKPQIKFIEHAFSLPIAKYTFVGKIDRIDQLDGGVEILDYKSNGAPKIKGKRDVDQLWVYQWAVEYYFKEKVLNLYYWHLKDNKKREMNVATPQELVDLQNSILESIEDIRHTIQYDLFAEKHSQSKTHNCNFADYL